jgi:hypothetical protein
VFEELGFRISGWNGQSQDDDASAFYILCGGWSGVMHNMCSLQLSNTGPWAERVLTATVLSGVVRAMDVRSAPCQSLGSHTSSTPRGTFR